jgi:hypothetical protein
LAEILLNAELVVVVIVGWKTTPGTDESGVGGTMMMVGMDDSESKEVDRTRFGSSDIVSSST